MARRLNVMVSSSVYGNQGLLTRISNLLGTSYNVWMSHEGTVWVNSRLGNFANCLIAVEECDVLLGIITGNYGTGRVARGAESITHLEMRRALEVDKPHYCLAHADVLLAKQLLDPYRLPPGEGPFRKTGRLYKPIVWPRHNPIINDLQVLDLYDEMTHAEIRDVGGRTGNWVHTYNSDDAALKFIERQFGDVRQIRKLVAGTLPIGY